MVDTAGSKSINRLRFLEYGTIKRNYLICFFILVLLLATWNTLENQYQANDDQLQTQGNQAPAVQDGFSDTDASSAHQTLHLDNSNVAVIIETDITRVPNLVPVMLHFATVLGPTWPVVLMTLEANWNPSESPAFKRLMDTHQIQVKFLPPETTLSDHHSVSVFLASPWIWEQFLSSQRVLLFQADSILCSKSPSRVEDFLHWDLIGAPIASHLGQGYNGGLSLRNPKLMHEITTDTSATLGPGDFEDQWFNARVKEHNGNLPSPEEAMKFAVESIYYERPLGYHQPVRWQKDNLQQIYEWCPEIGLLQGGSHFF
ncbi:hypothetical protein LY76DRAFT_583562 [Colletotrichum caudatum]|nr:hypothetical protein LY76DRAFT_583562 [Colletotrichum caudatum]